MVYIAHLVVVLIAFVAVTVSFRNGEITKVRGARICAFAALTAVLHSALIAVADGGVVSVIRTVLWSVTLLVWLYYAMRPSQKA